MTAYLVVIKDSFREALYSRVLWILLLLIILLLLSLLPLGWQRQLTTGLRRDDVRNLAELVAELNAARVAPDTSAGKHIWNMLPQQVQRQLQAYTPPDKNRTFSERALQRRLTNELNNLIQRQDFFQEALWEDTSLDDEAQELITRGVANLSSMEMQRLNRLALEAALPNQIHQRPSSSVLFTYLFWDVGEPVRISEQQLNQSIRRTLAVFMSFVVGFVGVFSAILVTAPIIPEMLDAGSINLLLSKPISRTLLFLAKFFGGCSYVLINSFFLIGGLWLLLGLRFGIWEKNLLLCVPVFIFLFTIYYSVSVLAGLVWRNTVVCIVITILFWATCIAVGTAESLIKLFFVQPNRLVTLVSADESLIAISESGDGQVWDEPSGKWEEAFNSPDATPRPPFASGPTLVGPVFDAKHQQLVAVRPVWSQSRLIIGRRADEWQREESFAAPKGTRALVIEPDGRVLAVAREGIFRMTLPPPTEVKELRFFGWKIPLPTDTNVFARAGPESSWRFSDTSAVALNPDNGSLFVCTGDRLAAFEIDDEGKYREVRATTSEGGQQGVLLAAAGNTLLLARADGRVEVRDARTLQVKNELEPQRRNAPRFAVAAPEGQWFAVLFHNRRLWLYDARRDTTGIATIRGQGDISAVAFSGPDQLLVADRVNRVSHYRLSTGTLERTDTPPSTTMESVYRFIVLPIYTLFPKPGELDNSINYLLTDSETVPMGPDADDLRAAQLKIDPWAPVWSSLAFEAVLLVLACVYITRQEF